MADDYMDKHFEYAGIEADKPATDTNTSGDQSATTQQQEQTPAKETSTDPERINPLKQDKEPTTPKQDQSGSGTDPNQQQGKDQKTTPAGNPGDITLTDGTVIKAGAERRWYGEAQSLRTQLTQSQADANQYKQKFDSLSTKYEAIKTASEQIGVEDPVQMKAAITLYKDLARDPAGTLKQLLEEVKALGHNVDGLSSTVDTAAIKRMIDESIGKRNSQEPSNQDRIDEEAAADANNFFTIHPDAKLHEPFIAALLDANPGQTLIDVYSSFKSQALANGFDWTKPLGPQIVARQTQQQQQKTPMISGNGGAGGGSGNLTEHKPEGIIHQADDLEDAILGAMRENGLKYSR